MEPMESAALSLREAISEVGYSETLKILYSMLHTDAGIAGTQFDQEELKKDFLKAAHHVELASEAAEEGGF